jgi:hypothetical protein
MTVLDVSSVSISDKVSRFFVLGSFLLIPVAAVLMMGGGTGMLLVQGHAVPPLVLAFGATLYGVGYLSFIAGMIAALTAPAAAVTEMKVAEASVLTP